MICSTNFQLPMKTKYYVYFAGSIVLLCAGLAAWLAMRPGDETNRPTDSRGAPRAGARSIPGDNPAAPRGGGPRQRDARVETPRYEHTAIHLDQFIVANVEGYEVTLRAAANLLMAAYKDACRQSRTVPLDLDFAFPESDARISFSLERTDFTAALNHLAALAGYEVERTGDRIAFQEIASRHGGESAALLLSVMDAVQIGKIMHRLGTLPSKDLRANLQAIGIAVETVEVAASGSEFSIRNPSPLVQKQIESLLATLQGPQQMVARTKLIHAAGRLPLESPYLDTIKTAAWLRMAADRSATISSMPTITFRHGEENTIELIKPEMNNNWTGVIIDLVAAPMGLAMVSRDTVRIRPEEAPEVRQQHVGHAALLDGDSHVTVVGEHDGITTYRMLSMEMITATGQPLRRPGNTADGGYEFAEAIAGQDGMVRSPYNDSIIDVRGIPSGTLVADPTFPMEERKFFRVP